DHGRVAGADARSQRRALVEVRREERSRGDEVRGVREDGVELGVVVVDDVDALAREEEQPVAHLTRVPGPWKAGLELRVVEDDLHPRERLGRVEAHDHETLLAGRVAAGRSGGLAGPIAAGTAVALLGSAHDAVAARLRQRAIAVAAVAVDRVAVVARLA